MHNLRGRIFIVWVEVRDSDSGLRIQGPGFEGLRLEGLRALKLRAARP